MEAGIEEQRGLYQKRIPIFPRSIKGKFRTFKTSMLALAYAVFFGLPWLPWSREGAPSQAVLFDLPHREFFLFNLTIYPQDLITLSLLLFIAAVLLFFVTGLVGRAFCGYFCFQTLWTDFFIFIEKWVQGERPARIRLYKQPWNGEKIVKMALTHGLWLLVAFWTGFTFIAYYAYAPHLLLAFVTGHAAGVAYATVAILTATTYVAAGLAREQVCMYMCPYARFQGVMYEPETLVVSYDIHRGEGANGRAVPHAGLKTREERTALGHGDCVDCGLCVQVCPVGIDIRKGLQYSCISCGLCIDACNTIMDSVGFPRGLVRYDSEIDIESDQPDKPHLSWRRVRTIGYGAAIAIMTSLLIYKLATRASFVVSVEEIRAPLFDVMPNGDIRDRYQIRVTNKTATAKTYTFSVENLPPGSLHLGAIPELTVPSGQSLMVQVGVELPHELAEETHEIHFVVTQKGPHGGSIEQHAHYFGERD
ncbi:MAG: cytochrome c oxidase accessory protein CcoG [Betaproteobacteria bacterium]|nr:cytochrome c oxidase accessory protein CcoG [Betaproteobacteria bacterium]